MEELIKALTILSKYMESDYARNFPTSCEHDVLYVCGVDLKKMDASVVKELVELGFNPGSDYDTNYYWDNFTQEDWENRWPNLTTCFHSYKYGSC
jgi:hypothetical protein